MLHDSAHGGGGHVRRRVSGADECGRRNRQVGDGGAQRLFVIGDSNETVSRADGCADATAHTHIVAQVRRHAEERNRLNRAAFDTASALRAGVAAVEAAAKVKGRAVAGKEQFPQRSACSANCVSGMT